LIGTVERGLVRLVRVNESTLPLVIVVVVDGKLDRVNVLRLGVDTKLAKLAELTCAEVNSDGRVSTIES
jgi:hypothetical protein